VGPPQEQALRAWTHRRLGAPARQTGMRRPAARSVEGRSGGSAASGIVGGKGNGGADSKRTREESACSPSTAGGAVQGHSGKSFRESLHSSVTHRQRNALFDFMPLNNLTKAEIIAGLERLGELAQTEDCTLEASIYGGALMLLAYDARQTTKDVDAILRPTAKYLLAMKVMACRPPPPRLRGRRRRYRLSAPKNGYS